MASPQLNSIAAGDNLTGHVTTASVLGTAVAVIICWLITLTGVSVPIEVSGAFSVLCSVIASVIMQRSSV